MSGHADTIRHAVALLRSVQVTSVADEAEAALDALEADLLRQADRIAWLEGEVAGWRIKLAECEARTR